MDYKFPKIILIPISLLVLLLIIAVVGAYKYDVKMQNMIERCKASENA